jgi:hypothetical protein
MPRKLLVDAQSQGVTCLSASPKLHYLLLNIKLDEALPMDCWIGYNLKLSMQDQPEKGWQDLNELVPELNYPGKDTPRFRLNSHVGALFCVAADASDDPDERQRNELPEWPSLLLMSGDQVYADDVAGPMLTAIHQLLNHLDVPSEQLPEMQDKGVTSTDDLYQHQDSYYRREQLLPKVACNSLLSKLIPGSGKKPIFTSVNAQNHLISVGEFLAAYLLAWSPAPWQLTDFAMPGSLTAKEQNLFAEEQQLIEEFIRGLATVRRLMAHLPVGMIFDDHDISDDWNLNRDWEQQIYENPLSRQMVGNGLLAYLINQGWGNQPESFAPSLLQSVQSALNAPGKQAHLELVDKLLEFEEWDFTWQTEPPLVVLDTRTRRWRSESSGIKPSGLIDWEALTDLQRNLRGHSSVLLASAAPIFGVKLIEVVQRIFTSFGKPLVVDAENWMAHPGTAHGILNVFRHRKTPQNFVVLSGDVHYSFVYDVELRGRRHGPDIWQICSSGLRNNFPQRLLDILDRLNRWLYHPRSPLNWFTSRRSMRIIPRKPLGTPSGRRLLNQSGIGLVELDEEGRPWRIRQIVADGEAVTFERREEESNWH